VKLRSLTDLFLYELLTLCDAKTEVTAGLLHMRRLASNCHLVQELKAESDQANQHMYLIRTIISSYQAIPPGNSSAAIKGLITSSDLLFNRCGLNAGAMDAALICASLDILYYELAKLERLRLYATLLSDRQTLSMLNTVLDDSINTKHRLSELMCLFADLDSDSSPQSIRTSAGTAAHSAHLETGSKVRKKRQVS
jgi:ferritin-like metal-binding protein YciE